MNTKNRWNRRFESNRHRFNCISQPWFLYSQSGMCLLLSISQKTLLRLFNARLFTSELSDCNGKRRRKSIICIEIFMEQTKWNGIITLLNTIVGTFSNFGTEISFVLISAFNCNFFPSSPSTHLLTSVQSPPASSKH